MVPHGTSGRCEAAGEGTLSGSSGSLTFVAHGASTPKERSKPTVPLARPRFEYPGLKKTKTKKRLKREKVEKRFRQFDDSSASRRLLPRLGQLALVAESLRQARGWLRAARAASAIISSAAFVTQGRRFDS